MMEASAATLAPTSDPRAAAPLSRPARLAVMLLFLLSGATGLIYEVTWVKILSLILGSTTHSVSTILTTFFLGLGLGGWLTGRFADRLRRPFVLYCILEILIAAYALAVPAIFDAVGDFYITLQRQLGAGAASAGLIRLLACFAVLLLPTLCMGSTLPLLARVVVDRVAHVGRDVGTLYAINTWGAVAGCFLTGFLFMPALGVSRTLWLAAAVNAFIGAAGLLLARRLPPRDIAPQPTEPATPALPAGAAAPPPADAAAPPVFSRSVRALLWFSVFASGFSVLALEVVWTRILVFFLRYTVYAFSTMLTTFLVGLAAGAWLASRFVDHRRRLVLWLGALQIVIGAVGIISVRVAGRLEDANVYLLSLVPDAFAWTMTAKFLLCAMVMLVPSLLMGMVFPSLLKIWVSRLGLVGRRTGIVYFINTLGSTLGSLLAGFALIPLLGLVGTAWLIAAGNVLLGAALCFADRRTAGAAGRAWLAAAPATLILGALVLPPASPSAAVLDLIPRQDDVSLVAIREGNAATITVLDTTDRAGVTARLLAINGNVVASGSPLENDDRLSAQIPLLMHPAPRTALVMGAAAGITMDACQEFPGVHVDGVEIVPSVVEVMELFRDYNGDIVHSPRARVLIDDARNYLAVHNVQYDVIINEAWLSVATGATPLYSTEFYELVKSRLAPGGIFGVGSLKIDEWMILTHSTVQAVFPNVYVFYIPSVDYFFTIASPDPLDFSRVRANADVPEVRALLRRAGIHNPDQLLACLVMGPDQVRAITAAGRVSTDDRPVYEYMRAAVHFLDTVKGVRTDHDEKLFTQVVQKHPEVARLLDRAGDSPELIDRRIRAMQLILQAYGMSRSGTDEASNRAARAAARQTLLAARQLMPENDYIRLMLARLGQ